MPSTYLRRVLLLMLVSLLQSQSLLPAGQPVCLRVLTYNIKHGEGVDRRIDLKRVANVIRSVNPDVVALQEVDNGTKRTQHIDQPAVLADLTGMNVMFGDNINFDGGRYGNAVLSQLPVLRAENHPLPSFYHGEQRGVFELEVKLPNSNASFLFFATHLDYRRPDHERVVSAHLINEIVASRGNMPSLLAGDLNAEPGSRPIQVLQSHWQRANRRVTFTYPSPEPIKQIDYVLFRPANRWRVIETKVLEEKVVSDHRPVLAVLQFCSN